MFELIRSNKRRSVLLVAGFVAFVALVGAAIGAVVGNGLVFTLVALVFSGVIAFASYWRADKIALAVSRARPAPPEEYQRLHNLVEGLCIAGGLPKPGVYVIDDPAPNAFATGRNPNHAAIAVTTGLLEKMNRVELEGVVAHELSHIRNYDILVSTLAVVMVGAVALMADLAIRTMWWNGGRVARRGDQRQRQQSARLRRHRPADHGADHRQDHAGDDLEEPRDAGRRECLSAHPVPARADLGAREAEGRHDGDAFGVHRYGTLVDRAAHERRRRRRQAGRHPPNVRHPPPARRANRTPERTLMTLLRPLAGLCRPRPRRRGVRWRRRVGRLDRSVDLVDDHVDHVDHDHGQATTTTTTVPPTIRQPLTGEPLESEDQILLRPALVAKIDNNAAAVPNHSGLAVADIVFEEVVEGRTTRFAAVFHSQSSDPIGPIRSGRTQDINLFTSFNEPLFVWSGGNPNVTRAINDSTLINMGPNRQPGYFRGPGSAPHNLYNTHRQHLVPDARGPARAAVHDSSRTSKPTTSSAASRSDGVEARVGSERIEWTWNPEFDKFDRSQRGRAHDDNVFGRIRATNVIVLGVRVRCRASADRRSPEAQTIGEGPAYFFSGRRVHRRHAGSASSRSSRSSTSTPTASRSQFAPGNTWIELADIGDVVAGAVEVLPAAPPAP